MPFLHLKPIEAVKKCLDLGADKVELFMDGTQWAEMSTEEREQLAIDLNKLDCTYSVHPPQFDLNLSSQWSGIRETAISEYEKAIEFAGKIRASHVVINPGRRHLDFFDLNQTRLHARDGIISLLPIAEQYRVKLGIENGGSIRKDLFNEDEFVAFVSSFNHELIGAVVDTGHARLTRWDIPGIISVLNKKVIALHLNDTRGHVDNHLPLGNGVIRWESIFSAVEKLVQDIDLTLELNTQSTNDQIKESKAFILKI